MDQAQENIVEINQERDRCVELVQESCGKQTDMKHAAEERCMEHTEGDREHRDIEHTEERVIEHNEESFTKQAQETCIEELPEESRKMRRYTFDKTTLQTERSLQRNLVLFMKLTHFPMFIYM